MRFITDHIAELQGVLHLIPSLVLGVVHGIEPLHSKATLATFVVATRSGIARALLLGISAAVSHVLMFWIIAAMGEHYGRHWQLSQLLPWFQNVSAFITLCMGTWLFLLAFRNPVWSTDGPTEFLETIDSETVNSRSISWAPVILLGMVSGIMPCALTLGILMTSLQSGRPLFGMAVTVSFSLGLAITMSSVGVTAACGAANSIRSWKGIPALRLATSILSCASLLLLAFVMALHGWRGLTQP